MTSQASDKVEERRNIPLTYELIVEAHNLHDKHCPHYQGSCPLGPSEIWSIFFTSEDPATEPLLEASWPWIEMAYSNILARVS